MTLWDDIKAIFNSGRYAKPMSGSPGTYGLTPEGDAAVKKAVAMANLPVVEYIQYRDNTRTFYVPSGVTQNLSTGKGGIPSVLDQPGGPLYGSLYEWTAAQVKKAGTAATDPLGLNWYANYQNPGSGPVVQYTQLSFTGLPDWYPTPNSPTAMSNASLIFENGKVKKVVRGSPFDDEVDVITLNA